MNTRVKSGRGRRKKSVDVAALLKENEKPLLGSAGVALESRPIKRLFDIVFSLVALFITAPIWLFCALLIRLTTKGPVLFASERIGQNGRLIQCYKLRTMYTNAEERLRHLLENCPRRANEYLLHRKIKDDPRITSIGHFLRRYSIDELPQFFNVLRGDLSVVGPRPYFARELKELTLSERQKLLCVRPGLTGPWQTSGRSEIPFKERVAIEVEYAKHLSFRSDLGYILKTFPTLLLSKGAL